MCVCTHTHTHTCSLYIIYSGKKDGKTTHQNVDCSYLHLLSLFIYLFLAGLGLHCSALTLSGCGEEGLLSSCGAQASRHGGLFCCRVLAFGHQASVVAACGLQSVGSEAVAHGPS